MKKLKPKTVNRWNWILWAVGALIAFLGTVGEPDSPLLCVIGVLLILGGVAFRLIFFRCPSCGAYLDRGMPEYCHHCGERIDRSDN